MRFTPKSGSAPVALACGLVALSVASATPAAANDGSFWNASFGSGFGGSWLDIHDRASGRKWEANPARGVPTLSKSNIAPMKEAIARYQSIVKRGGWKKIPKSVLKSRSGAGVSLLRARLEATGDVLQSSGMPVFDYTLQRGLRRFQLRHGLTPNGRLDKRTLAALNVPATARLSQLRRNLGRMYRYANSIRRRHVVVNIPAQQIEAIENGRVVSRHAGVVGKIDRRTPLLSSRIHEINFNPMWTLPPTVITKDLIPKGRKMQKRGGIDVLSKFGIDAYSNGRKLNPKKINWFGGSVYNLTYRQPPGKDNPMGFVKINFHNSYSVYMHDTPSQTLFGRNFRAASSGCIRVSNVEDLVAWILRDNGSWSRGRVNQMKKSGEKKNVSVKKPVPVTFAYVTAWASDPNFVNFRRDLYGRDGVGRLASAY